MLGLCLAAHRADIALAPNEQPTADSALLQLIALIELPLGLRPAAGIA
jgi:hypothetical protein